MRGHYVYVCAPCARTKINRLRSSSDRRSFKVKTREVRNPADKQAQDDDDDEVVEFCMWCGCAKQLCELQAQQHMLHAIVAYLDAEACLCFVPHAPSPSVSSRRFQLSATRRYMDPA